MTLNDAINVALELKLAGKPVSWTDLANKCGVHPEKLRGKARRRLQSKLDRIDRKNYIKKELGVVKPKVKPYLNGDPDNILVIGDLHAPFLREDYLVFCRDLQEKFNCGTVVQIGDLVDGHAWSYHESDPDGMSVGDELESAINQLRGFWAMFPEGVCTLGNHDNLIMRKAFSSGLSRRFIRDFADIIEAPKTWKFVDEVVINDILFTHGTGSNGNDAAFSRAMNERMPVVMGHIHSQTYVKFTQSNRDQIWAMQVGWGGDKNKYAFEYGKTHMKKPIVSAGVIYNGNPLIFTKP